MPQRHPQIMAMLYAMMLTLPHCHIATASSSNYVVCDDVDIVGGKSRLLMTQIDFSPLCLFKCCIGCICLTFLHCVFGVCFSPRCNTHYTTQYVWCAVCAILHHVNGVRFSPLRVWCVVFSTVCMVCGVWCVWCVVYDVWCALPVTTLLDAGVPSSCLGSLSPCQSRGPSQPQSQ